MSNSGSTKSMSDSSSADSEALVFSVYNKPDGVERAVRLRITPYPGTQRMPSRAELERLVLNQLQLEESAPQPEEPEGEQGPRRHEELKTYQLHNVSRGETVPASARDVSRYISPGDVLEVSERYVAGAAPGAAPGGAR